MDRLVSVDVKEVAINFRPSQRCSSAAFRVTNLMHTMTVAVHLTTTRPALFSLLPNAAAVIPPLSTASFTLVLPPTDRPPLAAPPDALLVRSTLLPTGKAGTTAVARLFCRPGVHVFRDASIPISLVGPHVLPALLLLPSPDSLEAAFLLSKAVSGCDSGDLPDLLRRAASAGNHRFVSALLGAGADPNSRSPDGKSALSLAVSAGSTEVVRALLDAGACVDDHPIHLAAAANRAGLVSLLASKADPGHPWANTTDPVGRTPVHAAAAGGGLDALRLCLQSGGDPDRADDRGWTALHCAAAGGHLEVAELLIEQSGYDAKRVLTGSDRKTPYDLAVDGGHAQLYDALHLGGAVLHAAARSGDVAGVRECLSMGVGVNCRDQNGWTALHRAAFKGRGEVVMVLIEHGAELDAVDEAGYTALRCAVEAGHADVVVCLVAHGARTAGLKGMMIRGADYLSRMVNKRDSCCSPKVGMDSPLPGERTKLLIDTS